MIEIDAPGLAGEYEEQSVVTPPVFADAGASRQNPYRVALLTPYDGGNLGDASIQDAMIQNLRSRLPGVRLSGISLSSVNFMKLHGVASFPLSETDRPFYRMVRDAAAELSASEQRSIRPERPQTMPIRLARKVLRRVPFLKRGVKTMQTGAREARHWIASYRFLRDLDVVIVSGGGQLDEAWGGPWGHPFALFKWAVLARIARVPYVMASVGVGTVQTTSSRLLVSAALRLACYRSYRDKSSRDLAATLFGRASRDPVVPDLAFGLSTQESRVSPSIRALAAGRSVIAISPIAFAKPHNWPQSDAELYRRYLGQLGLAMSVLLQRGYFLALVFSSCGDDESVIPDLLECLDESAKKRIEEQTFVPRIRIWRDYIEAVSEADLLIASRLHSTILGFVSHRPTVAISFEPKVDWVMDDLGQTEYLLHIRTFVSDDIIKAIERLQPRGAQITQQLVEYQSRNATALAAQYDRLAKLATDHCRS